MKNKIKLIVFMIILTTVIFGKDIAVVGSFNTLHLGWKGKDYEKIAQVVSMFDIVALQEVMSEEGIKKLKEETERVSNLKWDYIISEKSVGTDKYREFYGFMYKKNKVKILRKHGFYKEKCDTDFAREPFGADFRIGKFDFTLVTVHLTFGDEKTDRQKEALILGDVYDYFQKINGTEQDVIICGDFNIPAYDGAFKSLLKHEDNIFYAIDPTVKTTIGKNGLSSSYDNMFYSYKYTKEYTGNSGVFDFTEGNYKEVRKKISDHLPVFMEFNTEQDDD
jgi:deoxyribonuclease-1-like protein